MSRRALVLSIVATDSTFALQEVRGARAWVGKCIHCNAKLLVETSGETAATVEHIAPRTHGGENDPCNLALACARCNQSKGMLVDVLAKSDPHRTAIVEALLAKRRERWRDP